MKKPTFGATDAPVHVLVLGEKRMERHEIIKPLCFPLQERCCEKAGPGEICEDCAWASAAYSARTLDETPHPES